MQLLGEVLRTGRFRVKAYFSHRLVPKHHTFNIPAVYKILFRQKNAENIFIKRHPTNKTKRENKVSSPSVLKTA